MNSKVIKLVAGAGKTTYSIEYLKAHPNGLYLAFNNSVVDAVSARGFAARTIDSLFQSYIMPKLTAIIPIIAKEVQIKYLDTKKLTGYLSGVGNIHITSDGRILNRTKDTGISLETTNKQIYSMDFTNSLFIRKIFEMDCLNLTDSLRAEFSDFLIANYGPKIVHFIEQRFSYVIIDEAQDLSGFRENFAKLLFDSPIDLIVLGDDKQNINNGGEWFENLEPNEIKNKSFRCPEENCKWIRENLDIDICSDIPGGGYFSITFSDAMSYDDGRRTLLYNAKHGKAITEIVNGWTGPKNTIKGAKGETIDSDIVIIGKELNDKSLYTAITRTRRCVFSTIKA